jgi:hypothetical protein
MMILPGPRLLSLLALLACCSVMMADAPSVSYIFPAGGQRGTTVHFNVGGHYLHTECGFQMLGPGVEVSSRIKRAEKTVWFEGPLIPLPASQAGENYPKDQAGQVVIAAEAPLGIRRWRVMTSQGATATQKFIVGELPEVIEEEIDGDPIPVAVQLPITINGRIFPREDVDVWVFKAKKGRGYTCEVMAARLGSPLDSHLELRGPDGLLVADNTDTLGNDSRISFVAAKTGEYQVRIHDVQFAGLQQYVYRLTITDQPFATAVFPLGGQRGTTLKLSLLGQNLPADGISVTVAADAAELLSVQPRIGKQVLNTIYLETGDSPEVVEQDSADETVHTAPIVFNGRIGTAGERDSWWLQATAEEKINIDLRAARLGSPLDSIVTLLDAEGKQLAESDDLSGGQTDSQLTFTAPADGKYQLVVRDRFSHRGGENYAYRLLATPATEPKVGFRLTLPADTLTINRGSEAKVKIVIQRTGGFAGEVTLAVAGLPEGIELSGNTIAGNKNDTELVLKVPEDAKVVLAPLTITGSAMVEEQELKAQANLAAETPDDLDRDVLLLSVAIPTPYKIVGIFQTQYAPRGGTFLRTYSIERNGYEGPVTISLGDRQARHLQGVTGPTIVVPKGATEFTYPIKLAPWMEVGRTSRTVVMGVAMSPDGHGTEHKVSYTSHEQNDQIIVLVDPGQLSVELESTSLIFQPGKTVDLPFAVDRGRGLEGDVTVELVTPEHITDIQSVVVKLPKGQREGVLKLQCMDGLQSRLNMPLVVRVTAMPAGRPYTVEAKFTVLPPVR